MRRRLRLLDNCLPRPGFGEQVEAGFGATLNGRQTAPTPVAGGACPLDSLRSSVLIREREFERGVRLRVLGMVRKTERSLSPYKRFRVTRDAHGGDILASFDTIEEAISSIRRRRGDWRYVVLDIRTIVWPESRRKIE
jgi:hypothetical protein